MRNAAGYVQAAEKSPRKFFRAKFFKSLQSRKGYGLVNTLFSQRLVGNIQPAEIIYIFPDVKLVENRHVLHNHAYVPFYLGAKLFPKNGYFAFIVSKQG